MNARNRKQMKTLVLQEPGGRSRAATGLPMRVAVRLGALVTRSSLSRRTIRLRLTLLYGTSFLLSGAGLLAVTYVLVGRSPFLIYGPLSSPPEVLGSAGVPAAGSVHGPGGLTPRQVAGVAREIHDRELTLHAENMHHLLVWSLATLGVMAVVSLALGWAVAGRVLRPLRTITAAARDISVTNLHQRLSLGGPDDELRELADTFDALLGRLEASFDSQRRFVANASHELRTPLTITRTAVDIALRKRDPPPQVIALAHRVSQGLDQVESILESFLLLARAEHRPAQDEPGVVSLPGLVRTALRAMAGEAMAKDVDLQCRGAAEVWVTGNRTLLSRMVDNVTTNAIRHNEPGGWIRVSTELHGQMARLVAENGGRVLNEQEVQGLTQPFRRLGPERTGSSNGAGLGLSIVAAIATAHGGTLSLHARAGGGLRVVIELPAAAQPARAGTKP
jgi:signal transduction histidine kinase